MGIVPYEGLKDIILDIGTNETDLDMEVKVGDLHEGVAIAKEAEKQGYHFIISRGGTSSLIQKHVSIPVIEIPVSGYDLLRMLTLVKDHYGEVAIVGFKNITSGATSISNLLDIKINIYTMQNEKEIMNKLQEIQKTGAEVILGDVVTVKYAKQIGLNGILITSGKESVQYALELVKRMHYFHENFHFKKSILQQVIENDKRGIAIFQINGEKIYKNKNYEDIFKDTPLKDKLELPSLWPELWNLLMQLYQGKTKKNVYSLSKWEVNWRIHACVEEIEGTNYIVVYFETVEKINDMKGIEILYPQLSVTSKPFSQVTGSSEEIRRVIEEAEEISKSSSPLWIQGETGTGKSMFAYLIHKASTHKRNVYVSVDCGVIGEKEKLSKIIEKARYGTIFFKNIHKLPEVKQFELLNIIEQDKILNIRIISSATLDIYKKMKNNEFNKKLYYKIARIQLQLPSLRERKADIKHLSRLFIASFNMKYGKQFAGIRKPVVKELEQLSWPGNINQLNRVIEELVLISSGPYIEMADLEIVLEKLKHELKYIDDTLLFEGTLEEIEKRVIHIIMEKENMNQTRVAKRLGINRSTLWRKLKDKS